MFSHPAKLELIHEAQARGFIVIVLFDRLYVLRNQLVHGGATWNSAASRAQVHDDAAVLGCLLPVFSTR